MTLQPDTLPVMVCPLTIELIVEADLHGVRIDSFLIKHLRNYTSWRMQRFAAAGHVSVDEVTADPTRRVFTGERVRVRLIEPPDKLIPPEKVPFRVIYEDPWMLVVDKPAGVIAHPTGNSQTGTLANGVQSYLDQKTRLPGLLRPGIVHRLDRHTSGLMVVATHHQSHAALSNAFESSRVSKTYVALVEGVITQNKGLIDLPIGRATSGRGVLMSARGDAMNAKPSTTRYRVLERFPKHTLVEAKPLTGRHHQIRVHFAQIGHPLIGDAFYDKNGTFKPERSLLDEPSSLSPGRHALHASTLELAHPITGVWMVFHSRLADDMAVVVQRLSAT